MPEATSESTPEVLPVDTGFATSAEIGKLVEALAVAHQSFKPVLKDANNPFFKSKYADLAGVIEATSDALSKNGLVVVQSPRLTDHRIAVTTLLAHSSGQWLRDTLELPLSKFDAQGAGSAITYARRYAYQAVVGVAAEDDDGNAASPQTFKKQEDGSFSRATDTGKLGRTPVSTETVQKPKPVTRKKEPVPDAGKPWGGAFEPKPETTPNVAPASNAITPENPITDADVVFPGDENKDRPQTDAERRSLADRVIAIKKRHPELPSFREWVQKESGEEFTNNIKFNKMTELVGKLEAAEKANTLKELLEAK